MQNIKESKYYFSKNTNTSVDDNNFYGLLNIKLNRFYILSREYSLIKLTQFLFLKYDLFCVISFKNFNYAAHKKIDNNDCDQWGGSPQMLKGLQYDIDTTKPNMAMVLSESSLKDFDYDLQEKMFFLMNTFTKIKSKIDIFKIEETERIKETIKGLEEFKNFSMMLCPDDENIPGFVKNETESKKVNLTFLDNLWKELIQFLYNFDLKNKTTPEILDQIKDLIQNAFYQTRHANTIKTLKNEVYTALDIEIQNTIW